MEGERIFREGSSVDTDRDAARPVPQRNWIVCKSCCLRDRCTYKLPNGTLIDFDYMTDSKAGAFQTVFKLMAATFGEEPNRKPGSL